jgi:polar amino acid transport system permease protein
VIIIKATSLASLIGFVELTRSAQLVAGVTFEPLKTYSVVALIYLALCLPLSALSRRIERSLHVDRKLELGH